MPGQHLLAIGAIALEREGESASLVVLLGFDWQTELEQGIDQAPFCNLEPVPRSERHRGTQIWNDVVEAARQAVFVRLMLGDGPVANRVCRVVLAQPIA